MLVPDRKMENSWSPICHPVHGISINHKFIANLVVMRDAKHIDIFDAPDQKNSNLLISRIDEQKPTEPGND